MASKFFKKIHSPPPKNELKGAHTEKSCFAKHAKMKKFFDGGSHQGKSFKDGHHRYERRVKFGEKTKNYN